MWSIGWVSNGHIVYYNVAQNPIYLRAGGSSGIRWRQDGDHEELPRTCSWIILYDAEIVTIWLRIKNSYAVNGGLTRFMPLCACKNHHKWPQPRSCILGRSDNSWVCLACPSGPWKDLLCFVCYNLVVFDFFWYRLVVFCNCLVSIHFQSRFWQGISYKTFKAKDHL